MRHRKLQLCCLGTGLWLLLGAGPSRSATDESLAATAATEEESATRLPRITVVGSTPLVESDLSRDRVPESTRVLGADDINRTGIPTLTGSLLENVAAATINDTQGNVFQPDILFRGFTASPVAGTPQGIAVYVNGARFNDAFAAGSHGAPRGAGA